MKKKEESFLDLITQKPWEASQAILDNEHEGKTSRHEQQRSHRSPHQKRQSHKAPLRHRRKNRHSRIQRSRLVGFITLKNHEDHEEYLTDAFVLLAVKLILR